MLSFILPTRNRHAELDRTIRSIAGLGIDRAELIVVDNASDEREPVSGMIDGLRVIDLELPENLGAAARNVGARHASHDWIVMLDDDSHPLDTGVLDAVADAGPRVGAIAGDITLPDGSRERGGLPEVFVGCGVALRRELFLSLGGYDHAFGYYAEEYDLCARLIARGYRVSYDPRFRVLHRKVSRGRSFGRILHRLVRNTGWVTARYAPDAELEHSLDDMLRRYARVAEAEGVTDAFAAAQAELRRTIGEQTRAPLASQQWERFTGLVAASEAMERGLPDGARTASIIEPGKNASVVREAIARRGLIIVGDAACADVRVIGTLSPGPMLDALEKHRDDPDVLAPWILPRTLSRSQAQAA